MSNHNNKKKYYEHRIQRTLLHLLPVKQQETKENASIVQHETATTVSFGPPTAIVKQISDRVATLKKSVDLPTFSIHKDLSFNPTHMNELLDQFFIPLRRNIMNLLAQDPIYANKHMVGMTLPEQRELVQQQVIRFANSGLYKFDDVLKDPLRFISCMEMLYYHGCNLGTKAGVHFGLFGATVMTLGTEKHRKLYPDMIQSLQVRGAFCLTELGHGSNAKDIETIAVYDPVKEEFELHTPTETAQKIWIGNLALHATHGVVFAQLTMDGAERGVHAFVVNLRNDKGELMPGIRVLDCGPKAGLNGVDNGRLWLNRCRVPRDALLDRFATVGPNGTYVSPIDDNNKRFTTMISALVGGRVTVGQGSLNMAKVGLTIAVKYALTRRQFGPANREEIVLLDYLSHQRRLFPLIAKLYALQFGTNFAKHLYSKYAEDTLHSQNTLGHDHDTQAQQSSPVNSLDTDKNEAKQSNKKTRTRVAYSGAKRDPFAPLPDQEDEHVDPKELHILAAGLKPACTWFKTAALQTARECCGGMGFHAANRIGALRADSDIDVTWEGDNTVLLQQVAGALVKEFREQYTKGKGYRGIMAYLSRQMSLELRDKNPIKRSYRSEQHLLDLDFYEDTFEYREARLLTSLINRLQKNQNKDAFEAWNESLDLALELAQAHINRQLTRAFVNVIRSSHTPSRIKPILHVLCALFALTTIQQDMGWYLTFNYFSAAKSKAIWEEVNRLCVSLRPHASLLVESFGIPDQLLGAPIAGDWVQAFSYPNIPK